MSRKISKSDPKIKPTKPLRGKALLAAAVNQILAHPDQWNQTSWHCGTSHCVGGWCQILAGLPRSDKVLTEVPELVGLSQIEADWLFSASRLLPQIHAFADDFINDRDGFNRAGFDREGFNRAGFDREGFNRAGFNCDGFNCDGFNCDGFDRAGFDRDGFDRAGFDRAGFDRAGFDRAGFDRAGKRLPMLVVPN